MKHALALLGLVLLAQTQPDVRIDTYNNRSNRTGYIIVNPNTGRIDQFDSRNNRLGYGTVTTPSTGGTRIDTFTNNGTRTGSGTLPTTPRR